MITVKASNAAVPAQPFGVDCQPRLAIGRHDVAEVEIPVQHRLRLIAGEVLDRLQCLLDCSSGQRIRVAANLVK